MESKKRRQAASAAWRGGVISMALAKKQTATSVRKAKQQAANEIVAAAENIG